MNIKMNTSYSERSNTTFYRSFEVHSELPQIGDEEYGWKVISIREAWIDVSSRYTDNYAKYDFYCIDVIDEDEETDTWFWAIEKEEEDYE